MARRRTFNPKRQIRHDCDPEELLRLLPLVKYTGSPLHKKNPGDFCLNPPAQPRPDKTLCDEAGITIKAEAQRLLEEGVKRGLVSQQFRGPFPQNIWSVSQDGYPLEAQLENPSLGTYHGYPVPSTDDFRDQILEFWNHS